MEQKNWEHKDLIGKYEVYINIGHHKYGTWLTKKLYMSSSTKSAHTKKLYMASARKQIPDTAGTITT